MYWLLIYPIAGAVTAEAPFTSRSVIGAPLYVILISLGIATTILHAKKFIHSYIPVSIIIIVILLNLVFFTKFYFIQYPLYSSDFWGWQYGPRDIMKYFRSVKDNYDELYMSGEFNAGHIFLSFYDPENTCRSKCKMGDFFRDPHIYDPSKRQLFSLSPDYLSKSNFAKDFLIKKTIHYPNGNIAFQIGEIVK